MMMFTDRLALLGEWIAHLFMPLVMCYHLISSNIFLNTAASDARGIEKLANITLTPFQYLFAGNIAIPCHNEDIFRYEIKQHFDYTNDLFIKSAGSVIALPFSLVLGSTLKAIAYLFPDVQARHLEITQSLFHNPIQSNLDFYQSLGIQWDPSQVKETSFSQHIPRKPGGESALKWEKEALKEIIAIFTTHHIPFWADCGTCLGAYRHGGAIPWDVDIDIAVLSPDFSNIRSLLSHLDSSKYLLQDWSNRLHPETYLRVYIRKTREYIDIYHFAINPENKTVHYILSSADSMFMPTSWKVREKRFTIETPFELIFPLKTAHFDGMEIPVPNQIKKYLQLRYGDNLNPAKVYNEQTGVYEKDLSHPYWQEDLYPNNFNSCLDISVTGNDK